MGQAARWLQFIEDYGFTNQQRAESAHSNCDVLSRRPIDCQDKPNCAGVDSYVNVFEDGQ